jgi:nucleotide-binding universal stress UspA family protein
VTPLHPLLRAVAIGGEYERDLAEQLAMVLGYLRGAEETLRSSGMRVSTCAPVEFDPPRAICDCAQQYGVDLIAIATHGRGPVPRALLGSVADKVLRSTDRPVLIYRVEGTDVA